ncbi:Mannonate dehydratase [Symmachiella macrocystis]|uniref:mannonate dehydratase n=2 Tax=Symmachiella macrocystis TaxID=2527985 RepID=A0A5C6BAH9_9PLAN|nr:mannonate dehydratase [Symmachiella macrocystis]TWU09093.1 Mannonate dehydratase [Symmachiella macrocystis]
MQRREFLTATTAASALALTGCEQTGSSAQPERAAASKTAPPVKMHVGCQRGPTSPSMLQYFKRNGVNHICGHPPKPGERGYWSVEDLQKTRDVCEEHDVSLDIVALPFLSSSHIDREKRGAIMLGKSPERDRDIEHIQKMIANCAAVGIPAVKYNMSLLGVLRTERTPGRGGSTYSTWKAAEAVADPSLTRAGKISDDVIWERITYFLERIIPVCEEYKIRAACHPHDPGTPPGGFQGLNRVLGTVDGLKKFVSINESDYHGLNLCLGSTAEMLEDPAGEIVDVIHHFGERNKIFNIHFRNIRGKRGDFQEVYPDEGDMDMLALMQALRDVGYEYMVMPDHVPKHPEDPGGHQGFAFSYGYIRGLLQAVKVS